MAGPIDLDSSNIKPPTAIAYQDKQGKWRAGPEADPKHVDAAGNVDPVYAKKATNLRRNANMIKNIMREKNQGEGTTESDARETMRDVRRELRQAESEEQRRDIWREYVNS